MPLLSWNSCRFAANHECIVTTNRVGVIDEAFKSRIHVSLRYPSLDLASTKSIWEKLLNRIERDNVGQTVKVVFDRDSLMAFAEKHYAQHRPSRSTWNGRQIRNAFQTAIALGQYDRFKALRRRGIATEEAAERTGKEKNLRIELTRRNFQKIASTAKDFEDYMSNVRGSDPHAAADEMVRDDEYTPGGMPRAVKNYGGATLAVPFFTAGGATRESRSPGGNTANRRRHGRMGGGAGGGGSASGSAQEMGNDDISDDDVSDAESSSNNGSDSDD
jgi:hypothetical protein